ncbi:hypothetical protein NA56DRAFT_696022 [Hyaloscypha hepaticicola]|uniref:Uncharacterized protein n=1 Tax=Hyaloscypha hepaticicola TaxID=2082293 RepID=A0A2J6QPS0_9HELO|nr:hypothetical protein NA56DRAFT_696022 [Hyaloscypha hepaticicola]
MVAGCADDEERFEEVETSGAGKGLEANIAIARNESIETGQKLISSPSSRPDRRDRLTVGDLPGSTMRELFSFEFVWRAGSGFRRMSDERVSLESDAVFRRVMRVTPVEDKQRRIRSTGRRQTIEGRDNGDARWVCWQRALGSWLLTVATSGTSAE